MSKFSIIIPVYNVASYLRECLDSVLAQTFTDWEAICVDDGSTDGSSAILDEYAAKDRRFRVIHQPNSGVSAARNVALDLVKGEWVWFVDADDAIHPEALSLFFGIIGSCPKVDTISFTTYNESGLTRWKEPLPNADCAQIDSLVTCERIRFHRRAVWGTLVKRVAIGSLKFSNHRIGEDVLFFSTVFWSTVLHAYLPAPVYYYRTREGSAINSRITYEKLRDFLETEILMLHNLKRYSKKEDLREVCRYVRIHRDFDWYGYVGIFFRANHEDMQKNLDLWVMLQDERHVFVNDGLYRKFVVFITRFVKSVRLVRQMMLWGNRFNRYVFSHMNIEI